MVAEFDKVVFNEAVGMVHGPIETQFGSHLILITDREAWRRLDIIIVLRGPHAAVAVSFHRGIANEVALEIASYRISWRFVLW